MKFLNLPNTLTISRLVAVPFCCYALFKNGGDDWVWQIIAWTGFFLVGLTDFLDGRIARSRQQITSFGTFLDPVADKAMIATAMISLSVLDRMPWWITIVILSREVFITLFRLSVIKRGVIPANRGGKLKAMFQGFGVGFYVMPISASLYWFRDGFMYVAIALTLGTGFYYVRAALK